MSYSYSTPISYKQANPVKYSGGDTAKKQTLMPLAAGGFVLGAGVGGGLSTLKDPYFKKNDVTSTFANKAYKKHLKNGLNDAEKTQSKQIKYVLKHIENVKSVSDLKALLNNNQDAGRLISDTVLNGLTEETLKSNKESIIQTLSAKQTENIQKVRNNIAACWDKTAKKFKKPDSLPEEEFNAIKKAARCTKAGHIAKCAAIGGAVAAALAIIVKKLIDNNKNAPQ